MLLFGHGALRHLVNTLHYHWFQYRGEDLSTTDSSLLACLVRCAKVNA